MAFLLLFCDHIFEAECRMNLRSAFKDVFVTNDQHLQLVDTLRVSYPALCTKGCLDNNEKPGRNLQRFHFRDGFCECFLSDVSILVDFSDTPDLTDSQIIYHRMQNWTFNYDLQYRRISLLISGDLHPRKPLESEFCFLWCLRNRNQLLFADLCETGNHRCHKLATCIFTGLYYYCMCPHYMNGDGIFCSSRQSKTTSEVENQLKFFFLSGYDQISGMFLNNIQTQYLLVTGAYFELLSECVWTGRQLENLISFNPTNPRRIQVNQ